MQQKPTKSASNNVDYIDASITHLPELTLRGCFLAMLITLVFTAGNVYMGLKISFTFNSAIPAAVISMAILRAFKDSNILENTMVQTFASAAGTLSAVIFVLPGMVMLGYWTSIPFWQTMLLCATGGLLGVMFTIPLRRALVVQSALPYPEGVAAAEILRVGNRTRSKNKSSKADKNEAGIKDIICGSLIAGLFTLFSRGFHLFSEKLVYFTKIGPSLCGFSMDYSLALIGAGYLMRIRVGITMLIGLVIAWGLAMPWVSWHMPIDGDIQSTVMHLWSTKVRFIGIGTIAVSAVWTMLTLLKPIWTGIQSSMEAVREIRLHGRDSAIRTEKDIPITTVLACAVTLIVPLIGIFGYFILEEHLPFTESEVIFLTLLCVVFVVVMSFITASIAGYMAGLVGSSNSPISSIGIISTIGAAALLLLAIPTAIHEQYSQLTIALVLFMASAVIAAGCVSNDNMQDLKTGQLLGATPWRQQVALIFGVLVGAMVIPFILEIMYNAYGFPGTFPHAGMDPSQALSAPQAVMMTAIASGIITHHLEWQMISIGAIIAVVFITLDATVLKRYNLRMSAVAMGSGIYLPMSATTAIVLGSFVAFFIERYIAKKNKTKSKKEQENSEHFDSWGQRVFRRATLFASGLIVGESLLGVFIAILIAISGDQAPINLVSAGFEPIAQWLGIIIFLAIVFFYRYYSTWNRGNQ